MFKLWKKKWLKFMKKSLNQVKEVKNLLPKNNKNLFPRKLTRRRNLLQLGARSLLKRLRKKRRKKKNPFLRLKRIFHNRWRW